MKELQTIKGTDIPITTRGILYLCDYNYRTCSLKVLREILFDEAFDALEAYANIPNPESQVAMGGDFNELIREVHKLHQKMHDHKWLKQLGEAL